MSAFLETIAAASGLPFETVLSSFKIVMLSAKNIYIEGLITISSYSKEEISLKVKGGYLIIKGEGLTIKEYNKNDAFICGKIQSINII